MTDSRALAHPERVEALYRLGLMDTPQEAIFDRVTRLAQRFLHVPVCLVSFVDDHRQFFKAQVGLAGAVAEARETPLSHSFCQHVVTTGAPLVIEDARTHPLVRSNRAVPDLGVVSYLGFPLQTPDGFMLGSLCAIDARPRSWQSHEIELLSEFAQVVNAEIGNRHLRAGVELALQESEDRLKRLLGHADCLIWEAEVECTTEKWDWKFSIQPSGLFHRLFGERVPPPNVGLWYRFRIPEQPEMDRRCREALLTGSPGYTQEFRALRDTEVHWIRETVKITRIGERRFWLVGVATEITEVRVAEAARRESEEQLRMFVAHTPAAVAMFDREMRYLMHSARWLEDYGLQGRVIVGRSHYEIFPEVPMRWREIHQRCLGGATELCESDPFERADGTVQWLSWRVEPWFAADATVGGIVMYTENTTARKELERRLAAARDQAIETSRLKSEFLANMSHEIRTPMNGILGMADLLLETTLDEAQQRMGRVIQTSAESLLTVINDILDFSKIEAGKLAIEQAPFDLRAAIEDAMALLALRAHAKGLELICRISPEIPARVVGDAVRVRQVLLNLAGNAVKFTERGEVVVDAMSVSLEPGRVTVRIRIRDTGPGISAEDQVRLFQPFVQVDGSHTRKHGGTGLGLAISRQLSGLMGGAIHLTSEPGNGTEFTVELAFATAPGSAAVGPVRLNAAHHRHVLIVDDNTTNRETLLAQLAPMGLEIEAVDRGGAALERLRRAAARGTLPDLVILDWQMPEQSGLDVAAAIRADPALAKLPLVLMSSADPFDDAARAAALGFEAFLAKPVRESHLRRIVLEILGEVPRDSAGTPAPAGTPAGPHRAASLEGTPRVLLVDDSPTNQKVAELLLRKLGCKVATASNGEEALAALARENFAAVLMDCQMPVLDGYEATRRIRSGTVPGINAKIPVIALTAYAMVGDRDKCREAGMDDYVTKPIRSAELESVLLRCGLRTASGAPPATASAN